MLNDDGSNSESNLHRIGSRPPWTKALEYQVLSDYRYSRLSSSQKNFPPKNQMNVPNSSIKHINMDLNKWLNDLTEVGCHGFNESKKNSQTDQSQYDTCHNEIHMETSPNDSFDSIMDNDGKRSVAGKDDHNSYDKISEAEDKKSSSMSKTKITKCKKISPRKRQAHMMKEYRKLSRSLSLLLKSQKFIPKDQKRKRTRRKELLGQVRKSLKVLSRKLKKREKLYKFEEKKRLQSQQRKRRQLRMRKILRVVFSKRHERKRSMRELRIQERKRIADNLMLKAAKLRERANRLTAGRETRFLHRQVQLPKKDADPLKTTKTDTSTDPAAKEDMPKSSANLETAQISEQKSFEKKKKHQRKLTKKEKQKKKLNSEVKAVELRVKTLLKQFAGFCKTSARRKTMKILDTLMISKPPKEVTLQRLEGGALSETKETTKPKLPQKKNCVKGKKKRKCRRLSESWWRKDKLKAAKVIPKEKPKIDDFGSDSDLYDVKIEHSSPRASQVNIVKSMKKS